MSRDSRFSTLLLLEAEVIPMILATKKRSTNVRADDAVLVLKWINRKLLRRPWGKRDLLTIQTFRIAADLDISKSRVKHAKELLSSLGVIFFYKDIYNKSKKSFIKLWNISKKFSRAAFVWNPNGETITEHRPGKRVNPDHLRFKLVSKSHVKFSDAGLNSDTQLCTENSWLHEKQEKSVIDRLAGIKKIAKTALQTAKKLSDEIFYSSLNASDLAFDF